MQRAENNERQRRRLRQRRETLEICSEKSRLTAPPTYEKVTWRLYINPAYTWLPFAVCVCELHKLQKRTTQNKRQRQAVRQRASASCMSSSRTTDERRRVVERNCRVALKNRFSCCCWRANGIERCSKIAFFLLNPFGMRAHILSVCVCVLGEREKLQSWRGMWWHPSCPGPPPLWLFLANAVERGCFFLLPMYSCWCVVT